MHPLLKTRISISDAHFSVVKTETDFFNRIGRFLPVVSGKNRPICPQKSEVFRIFLDVFRN